MRKSTVRILIFLNVVLACGLAWLWFDPDGKVKNIHWEAPAPRRADFASLVPSIGQAREGDVGQFVATLDRPLFSPSRRPPPPVIVTAPPPPPPPDPLNNTQLLGLFAGAQSGGILARVDGKIRRIRVNERIGDWTIQTVKDRDVVFVRGNETRVVHLDRSRVSATPAAPPVAR
jgi:hypothetical protein